MENQKAQISAIIICKNVADIIEATIEHLRWCQEIIVVDSGSNDGTKELCEKLGCTVFERDFDGYGSQKNFAIEKAKGPWIVSIDSDEVVLPDLANEIQKVCLTGSNTAYSLPRTLVFLGRRFKFSQEHKRPTLRLFLKGKALFNLTPVHEKLEISEGSVGTIKNGEMLHYSYKNMANYLEKFNAYTTYAAQMIVQKQSKIQTSLIILRIPIDFFKFYILQRNFMEGFPGFVWAWLYSLYGPMKLLKAKEIKEKKPKGYLP